MKESRPLALVTGASSGIGAELAVELASKGYDLLLTGRDAARLEDVAVRARSAGAAAETKTFDLASNVDGVVSWVGSRPLDVLVNNAGFGDHSIVSEARPEVLASMIDLNITALTLLTRALLPGMITRRSGRILNVASTGAFSPVPTMAVYAATKSYVLSFGAALAVELEGTGVSITTLCPGATTTGFQKAAGLSEGGIFRHAMSAETVARQGIQALLKGKRTLVNGGQNKFMAFATRLAPRHLVSRMAGAMMSAR